MGTPTDTIDSLVERLTKLLCEGLDGGVAEESGIDPFAQEHFLAALDYLAVRSAGARVERLGQSWRTSVEYDRAAEAELALQAAGFQTSVGPGLAASREAQVDRVPLYPFQHLGRDFLRRRRRALLLDQQGLGKTAQALSAIVALGSPPTLVVCPAHLRRVWQVEAATFAPGLKVTVVRTGLLPRWPGPGEVVVCSYESQPPTLQERAVGRAIEAAFHELRRVAHMPTLNVESGYPLPDAPPAEMLLIGDELHFAKSPGARRTRRWRDLAGAAARVWGLTGTPLLKHPPDLWAVLDDVGLVWQTFGTWDRFREVCGGRTETLRFGRKVVTRAVWDGPVSPAAAEALRPHCLRRLRADVLPQLPDKTVQVLTEDRMGPKLVRHLDAVWARLESETGKRRGQDEADWMPQLEGMSEARSSMALAKLPLVVELISELSAAGEPVVVWSAHVGVLRKLAEGRPGWATITGSDSFKARDEAVRAFQAGELAGLACSIRAAGTGLTLTASHNAIFVDLDWQAAANEQAEDRQARIGQRSAVLVTVIELDHPLDKRVGEVCRWKSATAAAVLGDAR